MLRAGIVGLPNVGKSTLFNTLIRSHKAQAENYPFCTIDPNVGVVEIPDERLKVLAEISKSKKIIPTFLEILDIAGLVKGASKGEGLGNKFLSHIREVDAIAHVVRCFENADVHHVDGSVDPLRDIEIINMELLLADLASLERKRDNLIKKSKGQDAQAKKELAICEQLLAHLNDGKFVLNFEAESNIKKIIKSFFLLTNKPLIYVCNVSEDEMAKISQEGFSANERVQKVKKFVQENQGANVIVVSAGLENELLQLSKEEAKDYLKELGVTSSGLDQLISALYELLGLRTYLTTGEKETRAWTIRAGDLAPAAAGVIHTDFERGFISAEVVSYENLITIGSLQKAKELGKVRLEGKSYEMQEGDVVEFRFNV